MYPKKCFKFFFIENGYWRLSLICFVIFIFGASDHLCPGSLLSQLRDGCTPVYNIVQKAMGRVLLRYGKVDALIRL
jgi:hypothetical protein